VKIVTIILPILYETVTKPIWKASKFADANELEIVSSQLNNNVNTQFCIHH